MNTLNFPAIVPVFPLTGSLLLPGNFLPLNIFEKRYRNLVQDVGEGGFFGMIQPVIPGLDNWGVPRNPPEPDLYEVGCLGRVERLEKQGRERYLVVLKGITRFRVTREFESERGYRRVEAEYSDFMADLEPGSQGLNPARLLEAVRRFSRQHHLEFDDDVLEALDGVQLLNALSAALPLEPAEKQLLLEIESDELREQTLLDLMGMDSYSADGGISSDLPVVN